MKCVYLILLAAPLVLGVKPGVHQDHAAQKVAHAHTGSSELTKKPSSHGPVSSDAHQHQHQSEEEKHEHLLSYLHKKHAQHHAAAPKSKATTHQHKSHKTHKSAPRVQKLHNVHKHHDPVKIPKKVQGKKVKSLNATMSHSHHHTDHHLAVHHQFLAHSKTSKTSKKAGLKCYESDGPGMGEIVQCEGEDSACFIRYKTDVNTGVRQYYRRYCTEKSACAPEPGSPDYLDVPGFQTYNDGEDTRVSYKCCSMPDGCNKGAEARIPGADTGVLIYLVLEGGEYLQKGSDGSLSACTDFEACGGYDSIQWVVKQTATGYSFKLRDGTDADEVNPDWMVSEVGTSLFNVANGGGEALGGFEVFQFLPASDWNVVKFGKVCPTTKQVGHKSLADCQAACEADDECIGSIGFPGLPRYTEHPDEDSLCSKFLTCKCMLVTGPCEENDVIEDADMVVYASPCSGVQCVAPDQCHDAGECQVSADDPRSGACTNPQKPTTSPCNDNDVETGQDQCQDDGTCSGTRLCDDVNCSNDDQCLADGVCNFETGQCSEPPPMPQGAACDDNLENTVEDECDGQGSCAGKDYCEGVTCPAPSDCHEAGECDKFSGACVDVLKAEGSDCSDGNDNTVNDKCTAGGLCEGENLCADVTCEASGEPCRVAGVCDFQTGECSDPVAPEGTACDDGDDATDDDICDASGQCAGTDYCAGVGCPGEMECFEASECIPTGEHKGTCSVTPKAVDTACDDNNGATKDDKCVSTGDGEADIMCLGTGKCLYVTCPSPADAHPAPHDQCYNEGECESNTGLCTDPKKADQTECDDGNDLTEDDRCTDGICAGVDPCAGVTCEDPQMCEGAGRCVGGECEYQEIVDAGCDDGDETTVNDICRAGKECAGTNLCEGVECHASSQCHELSNMAPDQCDYATGTCPEQAKPDGTACDDGSDVTKDDECGTFTNLEGNDVFGCRGKPLCEGVTCDDPETCMAAGTCNPTTGTCEYVPLPQGTTCDDEDDTTDGDACSGGQCVGTPKCSGVVCTAQSQCHEVGECEPTTGSCSNPEKDEGTACDDGQDYTINDECTAGDAGMTCVGEDPPAPTNPPPPAEQPGVSDDNTSEE